MLVKSAKKRLGDSFLGALTESKGNGASSNASPGPRRGEEQDLLKNADEAWPEGDADERPPDLLRASARAGKAGISARWPAWRAAT